MSALPPKADIGQLRCDWDFITCYGAAKLTDKHLAATVHCVDDEIVGSLQRREQASISCLGESVEITADHLRRRPAR